MALNVVPHVSHLESLGYQEGGLESTGGAVGTSSDSASYLSGSRSPVPLGLEPGSWCQCGDSLGPALSSRVTFSGIKVLL